MDTKKFDAAVAAFEQVKQIVSALKAEHCAVIDEISDAEERLRTLPLAYLPIDDVKAGILEFVESAGERYAEREIRSTIKEFATGSWRNVSATDLLGKPLRYADLEGAIYNTNPLMGRAQLLTPQKSAFDDQVLYFIFAPIVREALQKIMDKMTPEEFGYNTIHPDKIGSPRAERREAIDALNKRIDELQRRKSEIEAKLHSIGSPIAPQWKG